MGWAVYKRWARRFRCGLRYGIIDVFVVCEGLGGEGAIWAFKGVVVWEAGGLFS